MNEITEFRDKFFFLSNFYPCDIEHEGQTYHSVEAAFQAAKTLDKKEREQFTHASPDKAKGMGRRVTLRPDWEQVKESIMKDLLVRKFSDPQLKKRLVKTGYKLLIEGNYWHDNYWGACRCPKCADKTKENKLGKLLMGVRGYYRDQILIEYTNHHMTPTDLAARNRIKEYYAGLVSISAAEPDDMDKFCEMDSIAHLFMDGCGDQYIVMAQEANARGFKKVIDIGCDHGWACHYFQAYGIEYTGIDANIPQSWKPAPCEIIHLQYPSPISSVMAYDRDTTLAVSSLCIGVFEPIEEQFAQLAKDFKHVLITLFKDKKPIAEKYFHLTHLDQDVWYMEAKD